MGSENSFETAAFEANSQEGITLTPFEGGTRYPLFFTVDETAAYLDCPRRSVERLIGDWVLISHRIGAATLIREQDLLDYLARAHKGKARKPENIAGSRGSLDPWVWAKEKVFWSQMRQNRNR